MPATKSPAITYFFLTPPIINSSKTTKANENIAPREPVNKRRNNEITAIEITIIFLNNPIDCSFSLLISEKADKIEKLRKIPQKLGSECNPENRAKT